MKKLMAVLVVVAVGFCGFVGLASAAEAVRVPITQTAVSAYYEFLVPADIAEADETRIWVEPDNPTHTHTEYYVLVEVKEAINVASVGSMRAMYFDEQGELVDAFVRRGHQKALVFFADKCNDLGGTVSYSEIAGRTGYLYVDGMKIKK